MLVVRVDGNGEIGSGHIMRCFSIARAASAIGVETVFAVSDNRSAEMVKTLTGSSSEVLGGNPLQLDSSDGRLLAEFAYRKGAEAVLVDTYAVSDEFFQAIALRCKVVYLDDVYTFEEGNLGKPRKWDVSAIVNYGFGFTLDDYRPVYAESEAELLIGPRYAPVRNEFVGRPYTVSPIIGRVLITCGSTNPNCALERMVSGCLKGFDYPVDIDVVIGSRAEFDERAFGSASLHLHRGITDLSRLMQSADLAISAGGSTLYELACIGVPTIALPAVSNQLGNARGFAELDLGPVVCSAEWEPNDVALAVRKMADSYSARSEFSSRSRSLVDGMGAARIVESVHSWVFS